MIGKRKDNSRGDRDLAKWWSLHRVKRVLISRDQHWKARSSEGQMAHMDAHPFSGRTRNNADRAVHIKLRL